MRHCIDFLDHDVLSGQDCILQNCEPRYDGLLNRQLSLRCLSQRIDIGVQAGISRDQRVSEVLGVFSNILGAVFTLTVNMLQAPDKVVLEFDAISPTSQLVSELGSSSRIGISNAHSKPKGSRAPCPQYRNIKASDSYCAKVCSESIKVI